MGNSHDSPAKGSPDFLSSAGGIISSFTGTLGKIGAIGTTALVSLGTMTVGAAISTGQTVACILGVSAATAGTVVASPVLGGVIVASGAIALVGCSVATIAWCYHN